MLRSVGSGTGPTTRAPVRVTCSTISRAATSSIRWSYARSLMRILGPATASLPLFRLGPLLDDLGDASGTHGPAALADREAQAFLHRDRRTEADGHLDVVAGHDHLDTLGQVRRAGDVGRAEVELRAIAGEERRVAAALVLEEHVDLGREVGVRGDRTRLGEH